MATVHIYPGDAVAWRARRKSPVAKFDRYRFESICFAWDRLLLVQQGPAPYREWKFERIQQLPAVCARVDLPRFRTRKLGNNAW